MENGSPPLPPPPLPPYTFLPVPCFNAATASGGSWGNVLEVIIKIEKKIQLQIHGERLRQRQTKTRMTENKE